MLPLFNTAADLALSHPDLVDRHISSVVKSNSAVLHCHKNRLDKDIIAKCISMVEETAGITFNYTEMRQLLNLFPITKTDLWSIGFGDSDVVGDFFDAVGLFLLRTRWPINVSDADFERWLVSLRASARLQGYVITKQDKPTRGVE